MRKTNFYFSALSISESLKLIYYSLRTFIFGTSSNMKYRTEFEEYWVHKLGGKDAICTPSARSGLFSVLTAWNIGLGDEVLVTGFTCSAVSEPIIKLCAKPIYVDINQDTYAMDPQLVNAAITSRTKCIIVQHTFGIPAPIDEICQIARNHNIKVIEDCALALGSKDKGEWLGKKADVSYWSFELSKTISVGWGGLVQINKDSSLSMNIRKIIDAAGQMSRFSTSRRLFQGGLSGLLYRPDVNFLQFIIPILFKIKLFYRSADTPADILLMPDDSQWKILLNQLQRLDIITASSLFAVKKYKKVIQKHINKTSDQDRKIDEICFIRYPLRVNEPEQYIKTFRSVGIEIGKWFSLPVSSPGLNPQEFDYIPGSCKNSEKICKHIINLPVHSRLSEKDINLISETLDKCLSNEIH